MRPGACWEVMLAGHGRLVDIRKRRGIMQAII